MLNRKWIDTIRASDMFTTVWHFTTSRARARTIEISVAKIEFGIPKHVRSHLFSQPNEALKTKTKQLCESHIARVIIIVSLLPFAAIFE